MIIKIITLWSVLIVTFNCGKTLSTSSFHSVASVVDSKISSCLTSGIFYKKHQHTNKYMTTTRFN